MALGVAAPSARRLSQLALSCDDIKEEAMRLIACIVLVALGGCATTRPDYAYDRPASAQRVQPGTTCSSSGGGNSAAWCGATVVVESLIHAANH
jgi:hypothetical protein